MDFRSGGKKMQKSHVINQPIGHQPFMASRRAVGDKGVQDLSVSSFSIIVGKWRNDDKPLEFLGALFSNASGTWKSWNEEKLDEHWRSEQRKP